MLPPAIVLSAGAIPCYATTYLTVGQAQKLCFAEATEFVSADVKLTAAQMKAIEKDSGVRARLDTQKVWRASAGEKFLGAGKMTRLEVQHAPVALQEGTASPPPERVAEAIAHHCTHGGRPDNAPHLEIPRAGRGRAQEQQRLPRHREPQTLAHHHQGHSPIAIGFQ